ncbi:MAG TPA: hypothetical protein VGB73_14075 [Pyrinomonadaceae bacterium]
MSDGNSADAALALTSATASFVAPGCAPDTSANANTNAKIFPARLEFITPSRIQKQLSRDPSPFSDDASNAPSVGLPPTPRTPVARPEPGKADA